MIMFKASSYLVLFSEKKVTDYIKSSGRGLDIVFFLFFLIQVFALPSIPSGYHSNTMDGWLGFLVSILFCFVFYPYIYFNYYKSNDRDFIREVIVFSVVARNVSFFLIGCLAVIQILIWKLIRLEPLGEASGVYYFLYYILFALKFRAYKKRSL